MNAKIMMVDDNVRLTRTLARGFSELKPEWELLIARNCREARDMFLEKSPSAALLDINLPDGNGIDLMGSIRRIQPRLPVVLMTGGHMPELRSGASKNPGFSFVEKPFSVYDIFEILESELHRACLVSQVRGCENLACETNGTKALAVMPQMRALALRTQLAQITLKLRDTVTRENTAYPPFAAQKAVGSDLEFV